jgi:hypothetical protein
MFIRDSFRAVRKKADRVPRDPAKAKFNIPVLEEPTIELSSRVA